MYDEDPARVELEPGVGPVVLHLPVALAGQARERDRVAEVIAVDQMHGQAHAHCRAYGLRADEVATVDHRRGASRGSLAHRAGEGLGTVVAIRDDANLHWRRRPVATDDTGTSPVATILAIVSPLRCEPR